MTIFSEQDSIFMKKAISLAEKGRGRTRPNPMVGAVIVRDGKIVSTGYHRKAGADHAEVDAIKNSPVPVKGADIYVTLEPCSIQGRTPPCTDTLISNGLKRVIVGAIDPNPRVNGSGIKKLARLNYDKCEYLKAALRRAGFSIPFEQPTFNEFVVDFGDGFEKTHERLIADKIIAGLPLECYYPELANHYLLCVTETISKEDMDQLVKAAS